jgi:biopolymer transport protein ExbB
MSTASTSSSSFVPDFIHQSMPAAIRDGGDFMYAILLLGIVGLAFFAERWIKLSLVYSVDHSYFNKIKALSRDGRFKEAAKVSLEKSHPLSGVLAILLKNRKKQKEEIESLGQLEVQKVLPEIIKRTSYINMVGNLATLVGLLGTIDGLIISFSSLGEATGAEKATILANGISTAMNTTAFGLIVAIPCIAAYTYLSALEKDLLLSYDEVSSEIIHSLVYTEEAE